MIPLIIQWLCQMQIKMARAKSLADKENRHWKYILLLDSGGAFFGDSLWRVFSDMFWSWRKRGKQWNQ